MTAAIVEHNRTEQRMACTGNDSDKENKTRHPRQSTHHNNSSVIDKGHFDNSQGKVVKEGKQWRKQGGHDI